MQTCSWDLAEFKREREQFPVSVVPKRDWSEGIELGYDLM
jgi:hypothetical protein